MWRIKHKTKSIHRPRASVSCSCHTHTHQIPQPIFAKKSEMPAWVIFHQNEICRNIRKWLCKFCVRWSNLCGSKAKIHETHAFCVIVGVSGTHVHMWYLYGNPVFQTAAQCVVRLEGTQWAELSKLQYQHGHRLETHPHQPDDVWVCHVL